MNNDIKSYEFLGFAKNISKSLNSKHNQKLFDHARQSATESFRTSSKRAIQKTLEATGV